MVSQPFVLRMCSPLLQQSVVPSQGHAMYKRRVQEHRLCVPLTCLQHRPQCAMLPRVSAIPQNTVYTTMHRVPPMCSPTQVFPAERPCPLATSPTIARGTARPVQRTPTPRLLQCVVPLRMFATCQNPARERRQLAPRTHSNSTLFFAGTALGRATHPRTARGRRLAVLRTTFNLRERHVVPQ